MLRKQLLAVSFSVRNAAQTAIKMNEPSICLTSTTFLNKELKHKNNELKLSTKDNKAVNVVPPKEAS